MSTAMIARTLLTAPFRKLRMRRLARENSAPMMVPFYHRIADRHPNDWTITKRQFQRQVDYCQSRFESIGLDEVQRRVMTCHSPRPSITFTFDDGYAENLDFALPLLAERHLHCVYFVTVDHVKRQKPFPHDVKNGAPLQPNTVQQLREISQMGIEIGLHTRTHIDLSDVTDPAVIDHEIVSAKDELEQMIGHQVRFFAFPYGFPQHLTPAAINAIHRSGMIGFCSAFGAYNLVGRDEFHIRRFHGDACLARFQNWLSFDSSKTRREPKVDYDLTQHDPFAGVSLAYASGCE